MTYDQYISYEIIPPAIIYQCSCGEEFFINELTDHARKCHGRITKQCYEIEKI